MTDRPKPKLLPVMVPWQIEAGAPYLSLETSARGEPLSATFIAFFKCDESSAKRSSTDAHIVSKPPAFQARSQDVKTPYRLVRVSFIGAHSGHTRRAVSDHEPVREADFDWTAIASWPRPGEPPEQTVRRSRDLWLMTGMCPDPCMYQVQGSRWIRELGLSESTWHHYLLLGHDEYVEVVAQGWMWEAGQAVT